jgi:DNA-binding response OmpR family regulator
VCKIIREKFSLVELPVIMLTAKNQLSNISMGFECGANDYIIKRATRCNIKSIA